MINKLEVGDVFKYPQGGDDKYIVLKVSKSPGHHEVTASKYVNGKATPEEEWVTFEQYPAYRSYVSPKKVTIMGHRDVKLVVSAIVK